MKLHLVLSLLLSSCIAFADLHDPNNRADYLIVTTSELVQNNAWINQLADWRDQHGRLSMVVSTEDIWNEFGTGVPSDTVLKDFLHYARLNWQTPRLKDVFIIGYHDVVPSHVEIDSTGSGTPDSIHWEAYNYLSDFFYSTDPESTNYIPVLSIGRLPWSPTQSSNPPNYLNKIMAYETAETSVWQRHIHLVADSSTSNINFALHFAERLSALIPLSHTLERDYLDYPSGNPWYGDRAEIISNLNSGSYLMAYLGQSVPLFGSEDSSAAIAWSNSLRLDSLDFATLTNWNRLPIVVGMGNDCHTNDFSLSGIPVSLLFNPDGGAICYTAWTNVSWFYAGITFREILFRLALGDSAQYVGDLWRLNTTQFIQCFRGFLNYESIRQTLLGSMMFGDPGIQLPNHSLNQSNIRGSLPAIFRLEDACPNPFNPTTRISFDLAKDANASLKVYNTLGQLVEVLINDRLVAGHHEVTFDGSYLPSGLYFYQLTADQMSPITKKMVLIK